MADEAAGATDQKPAGEQPAAPAEPEVKALTQKQLDAMLGDAFGRGAGKVHKTAGVKSDDELLELVELGRKVKQGGTGPAKPGEPAAVPEEVIARHVEAAAEKIRKESDKRSEAEKAETARWRAIGERALIDSSLVAAASDAKAVNADQVAQLLRARVRIKPDGSGVEVLDAEGVTVYGKDGKPISVKEFVGDFLAANPHFVLAGVKPGAGGHPAADKGGGSSNKTITRAEFEKLDHPTRAARMRDGYRVAN